MCELWIYLFLLYSIQFTIFVLCVGYNLRFVLPFFLLFLLILFQLCFDAFRLWMWIDGKKHVKKEQKNNDHTMNYLKIEINVAMAMALSIWVPNWNTADRFFHFLVAITILFDDDFFNFFCFLLFFSGRLLFLFF